MNEKIDFQVWLDCCDPWSPLYMCEYYSMAVSFYYSLSIDLSLSLSTYIYIPLFYTLSIVFCSVSLIPSLLCSLLPRCSAAQVDDALEKLITDEIVTADSTSLHSSTHLTFEPIGTPARQRREGARKQIYIYIYISFDCVFFVLVLCKWSLLSCCYPAYACCSLPLFLSLSL